MSKKTKDHVQDQKEVIQRDHLKRPSNSKTSELEEKASLLS